MSINSFETHPETLGDVTITKASDNDGVGEMCCVRAQSQERKHNKTPED